jgi:hypothetical protein
MKNLSVIALVLASACVAETTTTVDSELGLEPGGGSGNHFYWAAYEKQPYIYKGCPDPGPEPWAEAAVLHAKKGTTTIELELGTAVPLNVSGLDVPRGLTIVGNDRGASMAVDMFLDADRIPFSLLVNNERCSYQLDAVIWFE